MPDETKTVIRVFEKDAQKLKKQFGQPQWDAFRKAIAVASCPHPEADREYTTAIVNAVQPGQALNQKQGVRTIAGFRCRACGNYVLPDPDEDEEELE